MENINKWRQNFLSLSELGYGCPFDHNYKWRRVKWGEHGGMGPMQHSLTTATPFKSQKILFKARALGSNLIHRRLSTSQLPILDPPTPVTWFTSFVSCPPTPYGLPPPPELCKVLWYTYFFWIPSCFWSRGKEQIYLSPFFLSKQQIATYTPSSSFLLQRP